MFDVRLASGVPPFSSLIVSDPLSYKRVLTRVPGMYRRSGRDQHGPPLTHTSSDPTMYGIDYNNRSTAAAAQQQLKNLLRLFVACLDTTTAAVFGYNFTDIVGRCLFFHTGGRSQTKCTSAPTLLGGRTIKTSTSFPY